MLWNSYRWKQGVKETKRLHHHRSSLLLRRARNRPMARPNRHHRQHKASESLPRETRSYDWSSSRPRKIHRRDDRRMANRRGKWISGKTKPVQIRVIAAIVIIVMIRNIKHGIFAINAWIKNVKNATREKGWHAATIQIYGFERLVQRKRKKSAPNQNNQISIAT